MTVGEVCKRNVAIAVKNETIVDAANHMRTAHVGDLVVIETQQNRRVPVGILTDRDIVVGAVAANSGHLETLVVGDIVSPDPATAREAEPLEGALKTMEERGVRRLPVVDGDGHVVDRACPRGRPCATTSALRATCRSRLGTPHKTSCSRRWRSV